MTLEMLMDAAGEMTARDDDGDEKALDPVASPSRRGRAPQRGLAPRIWSDDEPGLAPTLENFAEFGIRYVRAPGTPPPEIPGFDPTVFDQLNEGAPGG